MDPRTLSTRIFFSCVSTTIVTSPSPLGSTITCADVALNVVQSGEQHAPRRHTVRIHVPIAHIFERLVDRLELGEIVGSLFALLGRGERAVEALPQTARSKPLG